MRRAEHSLRIVVLIVGFALPSFVMATELDKPYKISKIEWLEYKMNMYAIDRNFTNNSNVNCFINYKTKTERSIACIDGDYKTSKKWKKALKEMFQNKFNSETKKLKLEGKITLEFP